MEAKFCFVGACNLCALVLFELVTCVHDSHPACTGNSLDKFSSLVVCLAHGCVTWSLRREAYHVLGAAA